MRSTHRNPRHDESGAWTKDQAGRFHHIYNLYGVVNHSVIIDTS